jgi:general secretion pathway protein N
MMARATMIPTALAAALGLSALAEILAPGADAPFAAPVRPPLAAAGDADPAGMATSWSATILARPVFRPDRKPLSAAPPAATVLPRLTAIVVTAAGSVAIFTGDDRKALVLSTGGDVAGYKVTKIGAGSVELAGPSGTQILRPQRSPAAADSTDPPIIPPHPFVSNY